MEHIRRRLYVAGMCVSGLALFAGSVLHHRLLWPQLTGTASAIGFLARNLRDDDPVRRPWIGILFRPRETIRALLDNNRGGHVQLLAVLEGMAVALSLSSGVFGDDPSQLSFTRTLLSVLAFGSAAGLIVLYLLSWLIAVTGRRIGGIAAPSHIRVALSWGAIPVAWSLVLKLPALVLLRGAVFTADYDSVRNFSLVQAMALSVSDAGSIVAGLWGLITVVKSVNETQRFSGRRAYATFALAAVVFITPDVILNVWSMQSPRSAPDLVELRRRAEHGDPAAQLTLGGLYDEGTGVPLDDTEAAKWYRKAADQGLANAQYNLALMYVEGTGVPQNEEEAALWFRKAAEQGHAFAQGNLGVMFDRGQGVGQDAVEAVKWYRKAAEQGHLDAQMNLALMYDAGVGVPQDIAAAERWYRKAAERGHAPAQNNLGTMYLEGNGVARDYRQAADWYRKAAEQGIPAAQRNLALMYEDGLGVPQNHDTAVTWMRHAADAQSPPGIFNPGTVAEISDVQKLAKQWLESEPLEKRRN